jgi:hypothetical protein
MQTAPSSSRCWSPSWTHAQQIRIRQDRLQRPNITMRRRRSASGPRPSRSCRAHADLQVVNGETLTAVARRFESAEQLGADGLRCILSVPVAATFDGVESGTTAHVAARDAFAARRVGSWRAAPVSPSTATIVFQIGRIAIPRLVIEIVATRTVLREMPRVV